MMIGEYIKAHYGTCDSDRCQCVNDSNLQMICAHYKQLVADDWDTMIELAKRQYRTGEEHGEHGGYGD